ncbi:Ig-like domain-containing protein [Rubrivivax sp. RP6-9]|uniref:Ig-like domain-containing protein n=1 Tax=Rubrivivax sp. RP6-9 TaxID=3415750 RepID=UPI003CC5F7D1
MPTFARGPLAAAITLSLLAPAAFAAGVSVRANAADPAGSIFPSNRLTVFDGTQNTLRRVSLPKPDCAVRVSDCQDIDVINTLDGFSTQPRITVPFTGDIDPATVTSETMFLVSLGDTLTGAGRGDRVGINQVLWDPATKTLAVESDQLLQEHTRYLVVVTDGVRDATGARIEPGAWRDASGLAGVLPQGRDKGGLDYRRELRDAVRSLRLARNSVVAASLFSTQSASSDLAKINRAIKAGTPAPVDFNIGTAAGATVRAVFPLAQLTGVQWARQTSTAPGFTNSNLPLPVLSPAAVGQVAYGRFRSPDYATAEKYIPPTGTLTGTPQVQGHNDLVVQVFLPAGTRPAAGWPVAIFGHGFTDSMYGAPWAVASTMAAAGIATVAINVVGHGGGAQGVLNVQRSGADPVQVPAGGRGIDQDGNTVIDSTEGVNAAAPRTIISSRDGLRQTVVDLMQLVRQVEAGIDVDGDGSTDLDAARIYYAGQSFGGIYGTILLGSEPSIQAGVPNVPGGSITEVARLGGFRFLTAVTLATRVPQLLNLPPLPGVPSPFNLVFNENIPLRDQPPVTNTVPGATDIAVVLDRFEWVQQSGNPVSYAAAIRKAPPAGFAPKPVLIQFAKGDQTVPNPTSSAIVRAGGLADRTSYFRNDLAYALNSAVGKNPHVYLTNIGNMAASGYALAAQRQIATFFASGGATIIDPDEGGPIFEVPVLGPLPETLNYIP